VSYFKTPSSLLRGGIEKSTNYLSGADFPDKFQTGASRIRRDKTTTNPRRLAESVNLHLCVPYPGSRRDFEEEEMSATYHAGTAGWRTKQVPQATCLPAYTGVKIWQQICGNKASTSCYIHTVALQRSQMTDFWDTAPCSLVEADRCFWMLEALSTSDALATVRTRNLVTVGEVRQQEFPVVS
jgi:hypothetical protein